MKVQARPMMAVMIGLLLCVSLPYGEGQASCGSAKAQCENGQVAAEEMIMVQTEPEWDEPIRVIYESHLAPLFAACHCPFYGIEETESWNDPDQPGLHWWQVTVVLAISAQTGWEIKSRDYLFSARGAESPQLARLGLESPWPVTPAMAH